MALPFPPVLQAPTPQHMVLQRAPYAALGCIPLPWVLLRQVHARPVLLALFLWAQELQLQLAALSVALAPTPQLWVLQLLLHVKLALVGPTSLALAWLQHRAALSAALARTPQPWLPQLPLPARAAGRALSTQHRTPSAQQVRQRTLQPAPAMVATMAAATAAVPAWRIRGAWARFQLSVLSTRPPQPLPTARTSASAMLATLAMVP